MRFQVRDLMSNVMQQQDACTADSTRDHNCPPGCPAPSCQGQSGCPQPSRCPEPSRRPPKASLDVLSALRDQMRQALLPA